MIIENDVIKSIKEDDWMIDILKSNENILKSSLEIRGRFFNKDERFLLTKQFSSTRRQQ